MSYSEKLIEAYLPESYSPKVGISGSAKEEAKKIYKKAAELGYRDADAFHTAWDEDLEREGVFDLEDSSGDLVEIFNDDGELKQKWHYALYKVLPATPAIKALKQFWAHTYSTEPTKWPPYEPQALKSKSKYLASGGKLADIASTSTVEPKDEKPVDETPEVDWPALVTKVNSALLDKYNKTLVDLLETGFRLDKPEYDAYKFDNEYFTYEGKEYVSWVRADVTDDPTGAYYYGVGHVFDPRLRRESVYGSPKAVRVRLWNPGNLNLSFAYIPVEVDRVFEATDPVSYDILMDWESSIIDKCIAEAKKLIDDRIVVDSLASKIESIVKDHKTAANRFYRVNNNKLVHIPDPDLLRISKTLYPCREYVSGSNPRDLSTLRPVTVSSSDSIRPVISIYHRDDSGRCYSCTTDAISYNSNLLRPKEAAAFGVLDSVDAYKTNKSRKGYFGSKYEELDAYPGNNLFDDLPGYDSWIDSKIEHDSSD